MNRLKFYFMSLYCEMIEKLACGSEMCEKDF